MRRSPRQNQGSAPEPTLLVSWDLGKRKLGAGLWLLSPAGATLLTAGTIVTRDPPVGWRPANTAEQALATVKVWATLEGHAYLWKNRRQVCEWPQCYRDQPKYHADIKKLQAVGKALGPMQGKYTPRAWKGNVPKDTHHDRVRAALSVPELKRLLDDGHDALDAVGIGLFATARTGRGGVP